jgi:hypothetical protein
MSRRARLILIFIGLLLVFCSLLALGYAFWPVEELRLQATIAPTVMAPP